MVIPVWFGAKLRDGLTREAQGEDLAFPWPDTSPADSRKVPRAAPWGFSFVGRQFGHDFGMCDFGDFCGLKATGDIGNKSEAKQTLLVLLFRAQFIFYI